MKDIIYRLDNYINIITDIYLDAKEEANNKNNSKLVILKNQIKWRRLWIILYFKYRQRSFFKFMGY